MHLVEEEVAAERLLPDRDDQIRLRLVIQRARFGEGVPRPACPLEMVRHKRLLRQSSVAQYPETVYQLSLR